MYAYTNIVLLQLSNRKQKTCICLKPSLWPIPSIRLYHLILSVFVSQWQTKTRPLLSTSNQTRAACGEFILSLPKGYSFYLLVVPHHGLRQLDNIIYLLTLSNFALISRSGALISPQLLLISRSSLLNWCSFLNFPIF